MVYQKQLYNRNIIVAINRVTVDMHTAHQYLLLIIIMKNCALYIVQGVSFACFWCVHVCACFVVVTFAAFVFFLLFCFACLFYPTTFSHLFRLLHKLFFVHNNETENFHLTELLLPWQNLLKQNKMQKQKLLDMVQKLLERSDLLKGLLNTKKPPQKNTTA